MAAKRGPLFLSAASFVLMISGAAYAALPALPAPAAAATISLPVAPAPVRTTAPGPAPGYAEPHPHQVIVPWHEEHAAHVAHVAALQAPAPAPSRTVALPTAATGSTGPVTTPSSAATTVTAPTPAATTPSPPDGSGAGVGAELLGKALTMAGVPYVYGGDTPSGFDCSGLVYWAALQLGVSSMPRDTFEMLAQGVSSGLLVPVSTPSYGDLAFFGSGHVEFWVRDGETFGAQSPGTVVGYHSYGSGYVPTAYYRIT